MTWKPPIGRIVRNTPTGRINNAENISFNDNILLSKEVDASKPRCYPIKSGSCQKRKVYINRFTSNIKNQ